MFKIALNAGHYMGTAGKRCSKSLDPNETREWWLNNRICDKVEEKLKVYDGYQLLRIDDTTGATDLKPEERARKANTWGATFYLSVHHNAGIHGGSGGGIVAYTYVANKIDDNTRDWQKKLYDALIRHTGLKGNRATPLATANLAECRCTSMAAVLLELGFMDSKTDVPIILSEEYAEQCANAIVEVVVAKGSLTKKQVEQLKPAESVDSVVKSISIDELKAKGYTAITF